MEIRKASVQDLGQIMQVYDKARKFMRENGNAEQWGEDYPSAELIEHDIDKMFKAISDKLKIAKAKFESELSSSNKGKRIFKF